MCKCKLKWPVDIAKYGVRGKEKKKKCYASMTLNETMLNKDWKKKISWEAEVNPGSCGSDDGL